MKLNRRTIKAWFFILPSMLGFFWLYLYPFFIGMVYSTQRSGFNPTFVGLDNYLRLMASESFLWALKNTMIFMGIGIPLVIVFSYFLALTLYELKIHTVLKLAFILPIAIPSATVAGFFRAVFDQMLNTDYAMIGVLIIFLWRSVGYNLLIYLAAFEMMDKGPIEASKIDGANYAQVIWHIIIPLTNPATVFVTILSIMNSFKVFKDVYILQGAYPNKNIYMMQHFMNNTYGKLQYEKLSAAAYTFCLILVLIAGLIAIARKRVKIT